MKKEFQNSQESQESPLIPLLRHAQDGELVEPFSKGGNPVSFIGIKSKNLSSL